MNLTETIGLDLNRLPYFVVNETGSHIPVRFSQLTISDSVELSGEDWSGAVFREAWAQLAAGGDNRTVKLTRIEEPSPILGLVRPGTVAEGGLFLAKSLLETSPLHRHNRRLLALTLRGIGRVLVARLVAASYNQGAGGAIVVASHAEATEFYERIGFVPIPHRPLGYRLTREGARQLFEKATL